MLLKHVKETNNFSTNPKCFLMIFDKFGENGKNRFLAIEKSFLFDRCRKHVIEMSQLTPLQILTKFDGCRENAKNDVLEIFHN